MTFYDLYRLYDRCTYRRDPREESFRWRVSPDVVKQIQPYEHPWSHLLGIPLKIDPRLRRGTVVLEEVKA